MGSVFVFAFTAALNPTLLAVTTLLLTLPSPKRLLAGYLAGGLATTFTCGLLLVFALSATRGAGNKSKHYLSPIIDIVFGTVILLEMARVARHRDRVWHALVEHRHQRQQGKPPPRWKRSLNNASPHQAFLFGVLLSLPGASFVAGMHQLSKQHVGPAAKVGVVLLFNVIQFLLIEVPLVGYFVSPDGTDAAIKRFRNFLSRDGNRILLVGGTLVGLWLLVRGIIRLA
jgi:hypothetical protein